MKKEFICLHCHQPFPIRPQLKGKQNYCSSKACQQARRQEWAKKKRSDPDYRAQRKERNKRWYNKHGGAQYQSNYRKAHPDYCEENRKQQKTRNEKRKILSTVSKIVKTNACLGKSFVPQGFFELKPYQDTKIVKTNAYRDVLLVQLLAIKKVKDIFPIDSG